MTRDECERYGIRETDGEFDTISVREVISEILEEAGVGGTFCRSREKLLVQLYPIREGGAELFITKLSNVGEREQRAISRAENISTYTKDVAHFAFDSLEDLVRAVRLFGRKKKSADVYLSEDGKYLLCVEEERLGILSDCDILSEFSHRLTGSLKPRPEYDMLLAKGNAIEVFSKL